MKNRITGRSAFLALLKDEGITHLFGNPGTTELPIMHALKDHPDLTYVMAMQDSTSSTGRSSKHPITIAALFLFRALPHHARKTLEWNQRLAGVGPFLLFLDADMVERLPAGALKE